MKTVLYAMSLGYFALACAFFWASWQPGPMWVHVAYTICALCWVVSGVFQIMTARLK